MEWTETLRSAIDYMEQHICEPITAEEVAAHVYMSPFYLQKGFEIVTGYSISRYLRCRRLYLAALDLVLDRGRVIDIAYRYGFETPESFTKAFVRFHGATPTQIKKEHKRLKPFFPLKVMISVQGGESLEYTVEHKEKFTVIGFGRDVPFESGYREIPEFWEEFDRQYCTPIFSGKEPQTPEEKAFLAHGIGEFGVCVDEERTPGMFRYLIAGSYRGGPIPEGMELFEFPAMDWAVFPCRGPLPGTLQAINTKVFQEWLPGNTEYRIAMGANIEWYSDEGKTDSDGYRAAIWVPVEKL